jgi:Fis family transcriptional regulator
LQLDFRQPFSVQNNSMTTRKQRGAAADPDHPIPLRQNVRKAIRRYLEDMGTSQPDSLYQTLLAEVEPPLLEEVLRYTRGNQSRTAKILGMTRNTLRSKLNRYRITIGPRES